MNSPEAPRHGFVALLKGQLRSVGFALVREAILAALALTAICLITLMMALQYDEQLFMEPGLLQPAVGVGMILPFAVWKGDPLFGRAYLWTLPVRRQEAAIAKMLAGAFWFMVAILIALVALGIVAVASGGGIGVNEVRLVDTGGGVASAAHIGWTTPFWMWLTPFLGALILYLFTSAALLGLRYPFRWLAGVAVGVPIIVILIVRIAPSGAVEPVLQQIGDAFWGGSFGVDFVLNGGETTLAEAVDRTDRDRRILWSALPEPGRWAAATLFWLSAAALAVALALRRHWER